ncbi:MAG: type II secretion system protein GspM [Gemmatimonadales bacterium]
MTGRDRKALMVGGAVVGLALLVLRVGPWGWRTVQETRAELQARAELLGRVQADVRLAAGLEDSAGVIRARMAALAPKLLAGGTAGEAAADLGSRLAAAAERHSVRVSRTDPVADSVVQDRLGQVVLRAALESDTRGLFGLLQAVGEETAVLVADDLRIAVADPHVPGDRPELLRTELTLRGWYLPGKRSP